jgi:hypothetical protein
MECSHARGCGDCGFDEEAEALELRFEICDIKKRAAIAALLNWIV